MQSAALSEIVERQLSGAELGNSKDRNRCKADNGRREADGGNESIAARDVDQEYDHVVSYR